LLSPPHPLLLHFLSLSLTLRRPAPRPSFSMDVPAGEKVPSAVPAKQRTGAGSPPSSPSAEPDSTSRERPPGGRNLFPFFPAFPLDRFGDKYTIWCHRPDTCHTYHPTQSGGQAGLSKERMSGTARTRVGTTPRLTVSGVQLVPGHCGGQRLSSSSCAAEPFAKSEPRRRATGVGQGASFRAGGCRDRGGESP